MRKTKNNYVPAEYGGYLFPKSCLPDILPGDRRKVLTVNNTETEAEWEQASGGGGMVVYVDNPVYTDGVLSGGTLDHTWNEINNALRSGTAVTILIINGNSIEYIYINKIFNRDNEDYVIIGFTNNSSIGIDFLSITFYTHDPESYPVKW